MGWDLGRQDLEQDETGAGSGQSGELKRRI